VFKNIVWATDGSEHSDRALRYAKELAMRDDANLHVLHVIERIAASRAAGLTWRADEDDVEAKVKAQMLQLSQAGAKASLMMTSGHESQPAQDIADASLQVGADLIVIGTRGHSAIGGLLLGSVTQRLLHLAPCAVLAIPPIQSAVPEAEEAVAETNVLASDLKPTGAAV
jgi:nucleotide-binding universal stress UspA family protein